MSTISSADRVKASRLRAKMNDGKTLTAAESGFLVDYEQRSTRALVKKATSTKLVPKADDGPVVRGPQLKLGGADPAPKGAHETVPIEARTDPKEKTWIPVMPAAAADEPAPPDGAPPPTPQGTPLVDDAQQPAQGTGDPHAAEQLAVFVVAFAALGIEGARELVDELDLPAIVRELVKSDGWRQQYLGHVSQSAQRLAIKYGFKGVPMGDEVVVASALGGSAFVLLQQHKRKKLKAGKQPTKKPAPAPTPDAPPNETQQNEAPAGGLNDLWRDP